MVVFVDDITETEKTTMTERSMNLIDVVRQCGDGDLLRQLAETTLAQLMEMEVAQRLGAERHERSGERVAYRNGYRDRTLGHALRPRWSWPSPSCAGGAISRPSWNRGGCRSGPWWR
jgi:hypothetical protein